jgi:hypothetical protein
VTLTSHADRRVRRAGVAGIVTCIFFAAGPAILVTGLNLATDATNAVLWVAGAALFVALTAALYLALHQRLPAIARLIGVLGFGHVFMPFAGLNDFDGTTTAALAIADDAWYLIVGVALLNPHIKPHWAAVLVVVAIFFKAMAQGIIPGGHGIGTLYEALIAEAAFFFGLSRFRIEEAPLPPA